MKVLFLTALALIAFAGNSVLCRLALGENAIDAASFTWIRLLSGVVVLLVILQVTKSEANKASKGSWKAALMLFLYAITFSFAYISLDTGIGALILFASVQITIIFKEFLSGKKFLLVEWLGIAIAFLGFLYLVAPSLSTPSINGFILMCVAGIAWGYYTLAGRGSNYPLSDTAYNFARTLPFVLILALLTLRSGNFSVEGILLAVVSGAVTSGIGYAIWYVALGGLSGIQASVVQLLVPAIAALGGVLFAGEIISARLLLSSAMTLGGILILILGGYYFKRHAETKT